MAKFQIRDKRFGLALRDADTAADALAAFVADKAKADALVKVEVDDLGVGSVRYAGRMYYACPPGTEHTVPCEGASD